MITADILASIPLFASAPEHERESIAMRSADVRLQAGEWLIHEGEVPSFFALVSGKIAVIKRVGREDRTINTYVPGDYFGEVPILLGSPAVASLRALEPSRVLRLEAADFRELVVMCRALNEEVLRTMVRRTGHLQQIAVDTPIQTATLVGRRLDLECHDMRDFLSRNHIAFTWLDPDDASAVSRIPRAVIDAARFPAIIFADGSLLTAPTYRELAARLGLHTEPSAVTYDVAIVGGGPAGLAAAVYGASEGLRTILIEREAVGGQAGTSSRIENYLGFPNGVSGDDLSARAWEQAQRFGAEILVARGVASIECGYPGHRVILDDGVPVVAKTIVLATGVAWRVLNADGIDRYIGRGVSYGAARTESLAMRGKTVILVGGGNSAGQAAMFFSNYARSVTLLVRGDSLQQSMSHYLIEQLATKTNIRVATNCVVTRVEGGDGLTGIVVRDEPAGAERLEPCDGLFVFIGADAQTSWLPPALVRDERGYVCTGRDIFERPDNGWSEDRDPALLETSVPGIFAAGDVRHGSIKRVASGVGEGSMTIALIHRYLAEQESRASAVGGVVNA